MTTLYFQGAAEAIETACYTGAYWNSVRDTNASWYGDNGGLLTTRSSGSFATASATTASGPTAGYEFGDGTIPYVFMSPPLAADVTISGQVTFVLWGYEGDRKANAAINGCLLRIAADGTVSEIARTSNTTELGTSWTEYTLNVTPGTGVTCHKGDRLAVTAFIDDAGTMASGYNCYFAHGSSTASGTGDSYVTTTETLSFASAPSGTTVYLTSTGAGINPGSADEKEAWTSRGSSATWATTNTAAGPTSPIQITSTGGGTTLEWYTKPLQATTLAGVVKIELRGYESSASANAQLRCEIARTDGDGSNATVWGSNGVGSGYVGELGTADTYPATCWVSGDDLAISNGQRLRIRVFIDDAMGAGYSALASGYTVSFGYNASSSGTADSFCTFPITLSEYTAGTMANAGVATATGAALFKGG